MSFVTRTVRSNCEFFSALAMPTRAPQEESRSLLPVVDRVRPNSQEKEEESRIFRGSYAAAFACLLGMVVSMVFEYYRKGNQLEIDSSLVVTTIVMLMESGTSEKFYYMTALRMLGILIGVAMGMTLAILETLIESTYKGTTLRGLNHLGAHHLDWVLILYRCVSLTPIIFVCSLYMRSFPRYTTVFLMVAMQCISTLLSPTLRDATAVAAGSLLALVVSVISMAGFRNYSSESLLMETHKKVFADIVGIMQLAMRPPDMHSDEQFAKLTKAVEESFRLCDSSFEQYHVWRKWTGRNVDHDFAQLLVSARPLYYQSHAIYWSNYGSRYSSQTKSRVWFCDSQFLYEAHFQRISKDLWESLESVRIKVNELFTNESIKNDPEQLFESFHTLIHTYIRDALINAEKDLRRTFMRYKGTCFSSLQQQWNLANFLHELTMSTLGIIGYVAALVTVFVNQESYKEILLDELKYLTYNVNHMWDDDTECHEGDKNTTLGIPVLESHTSKPPKKHLGLARDRSY